MRHAITAVLIVAAGGLLDAQRETTLSPRSDVAVGIVRGDGSLQPFALLQRDTWQPLFVDAADIEHVMKLTERGRNISRDLWKQYPFDQATEASITIGKARTIPTACYEVEGFQTDALRRRRGEPWPTAIAVGGGAEFARTEDVLTRSDAASRAAATVIVQTVQALEADSARRADVDRLRDLTATRRTARPVRIRQFSRIARGGRAHYYFQAEKEYVDIDTVFWVSGWVRQEPSGTALLDVFGTATDRERKELTHSRVRGAIRLADRDTWILEEHHWEGGGYSLYDVGIDGLRKVLTVFAC